jgi:DNA adenine methylase
MKHMAPFRYWGAKVRMAPWIIERLPPHNHFVETCAGCAAVMAAKPPAMFETVNDVYHEVVNFFRVLRDPEWGAELIDRVALTPYAREEFKAAWQPGESPVDQAWAFFIRMQMAVVPGKTGWSYSVDGRAAKQANKPGRWASMPEHLRTIAARFAKVQVSQWPVDECLARLDDPGILHLVDPPYLEESRPKSAGHNSAYENDAFNHVTFVEAVRATKHADIFLTHYPHAFYDQGPWTVVGDFESHRNIPNGPGRQKVVERLYRYRR